MIKRNFFLYLTVGLFSSAFLQASEGESAAPLFSPAGADSPVIESKPVEPPKETPQPKAKCWCEPGAPNCPPGCTEP